MYGFSAVPESPLSREPTASSRGHGVEPGFIPLFARMATTAEDDTLFAFHALPSPCVPWCQPATAIVTPGQAHAAIPLISFLPIVNYAHYADNS